MEEITAGRLAQLLGVTPRTITELAKDGVLMRGKKRGSYDLQASVSGYCHHLRSMAAGRGGEAGQTARERLGSAQATLAEAKAAQIRGETAEVEDFWRSKLKAFRNRVLAIPHRVEYLSARQTLTLTQELRACLDELADG